MLSIWWSWSKILILQKAVINAKITLHNVQSIIIYGGLNLYVLGNYILFFLLGEACGPFYCFYVTSNDISADQFVLAVTDRSQVKAVSMEATDPHSYYRDRAQGIRKVRAAADEVLMMKPDLVVRSWAGDRRFLSLMKRMNIPVHTVRYAEDQKAVRQNLRSMAKAVGQEGHGEDMIADMDARMVLLKSASRYGKQALYLTPGAYTTGGGTFIDRVIKLSGLDNKLSVEGKMGWLPVPLEHLVISPPELIIASFYDVESATQYNWGFGRHAYVKNMLKVTPRIDVPGRFMACNGFFLVDAAEHIRRQMDHMDKDERAAK